MATRYQRDMLELQQDIPSCRELWGLLRKWLNPDKNIRIGQITYRIFMLARDLQSRGVDTPEGSTNVEGRLSVACREECEDLFAELKQDIINCRGLWALIDKWSGPTKAFRLGQITYRIYEVAREVFGGATVEGQGSAPVENRLSVPYIESSNDLFEEVNRAIQAFKDSVEEDHDLVEARAHIIQGFERSVATLRESSKDLEHKAKNIEKELHSIILMIDSFM